MQTEVLYIRVYYKWSLLYIYKYCIQSNNNDNLYTELEDGALVHLIHGYAEIAKGSTTSENSCLGALVLLLPRPMKWKNIITNVDIAPGLLL